MDHRLFLFLLLVAGVVLVPVGVLHVQVHGPLMLPQLVLGAECDVGAELAFEGLAPL